MKIFISYGALHDQVTALRLQALAAVHDLTVYVPPVHTRRSSRARLDPDSMDHLNSSDVVLGVVGTGLSKACQLELDFSLTSSKATMVMAEPAFAAQLRQSGLTVVVIDPANPERAEMEIVQRLASIDAEQNPQKALLALGTIALGLLILAPQD